MFLDLWVNFMQNRLIYIIYSQNEQFVVHLFVAVIINVFVCVCSCFHE